MLQFVTVFLILIIFKSSQCNETISLPKIIAYEPYGIRISLTDIDGVSEFFFWGNVNKELEGTDLGDITLDAFEPNDDGQWVIEDEEIPLKRGDVIHYILFVKKHGIMRKLEQMSYEVTETVPRPPTTTSSTTETTPSTTTATTPSITTPSTTTTLTTPTTTTTTTEAIVTPISTSTLPPTTPATSTTSKPSSCWCADCPEILIEVGDDSVKYFEKSQAQTRSNKEHHYSVPYPAIVVYTTGLRISIPDEPGIELVYFQGRRNPDENLPDKDIIAIVTRELTDGKWVLSENHTSFTVGDFIKYWLYVKKDGVGYRLNSAYYEVTEILPYNSNATSIDNADLPIEVSTPEVLPIKLNISDNEIDTRHSNISSKIE